MRKMGTERSRHAQHKQDKQTTLCPETNLLRSRGERSRQGRKLSPTAPEHCYSCLGALLQRLRKVAPKPPEKAYSPLRKNSKLRKTMTAKLSRGCCKAVTYVGLLARQKPPAHISGERKAAGRSLPPLGKELQSDRKGTRFGKKSCRKAPSCHFKRKKGEHERVFRSPQHMVFNSETTVSEQQFFGTFILQLPPPDDTAHAEGRASWPALAILFRLGCRQPIAADAYLRFFRESLGTFILAPSPSESTPLTT